MLGVGKSRKKRRLLRRLPSLLSSAYEGRSGAHKALHLIARLCASQECGMFLCQKISARRQKITLR